MLSCVRICEYGSAGMWVPCGMDAKVLAFRGPSIQLLSPCSRLWAETCFYDLCGASRAGHKADNAVRQHGLREHRLAWSIGLVSAMWGFLSQGFQIPLPGSVLDSTA